MSCSVPSIFQKGTVTNLAYGETSKYTMKKLTGLHKKLKSWIKIYRSGTLNEQGENGPTSFGGGSSLG
jgi:hypothetical protein